MQREQLIKILSYIVIKSDFKSVLKKFEEQGILRNEIEEYFQHFKKIKQKNKIKQVEEKNIDYWGKKSFQEFKDFIDKLKDTKTASEEKKLKKMEGAELVAENDDYWVYKITNHDAVRTYGSGTKWCITEPDAKWWNKYKLRNDFYFYIAKHKNKEDPLYKVAMTIDRHGKKTFFDAMDLQIEKPPTNVKYKFKNKELTNNSKIDKIALAIEDMFKNEEAYWSSPDAYFDSISIEYWDFHPAWLDDEEFKLFEQLEKLMGIDDLEDYDDVSKEILLDCCDYAIKESNSTGYSLATYFLGQSERNIKDIDPDLAKTIQNLNEEEKVGVQSMLDILDVSIDLDLDSLDFSLGQEDDYLVARINKKFIKSKIAEIRKKQIKKSEKSKSVKKTKTRKKAT